MWRAPPCRQTLSDNRAIGPSNLINNTWNGCRRLLRRCSVHISLWCGPAREQIKKGFWYATGETVVEPLISAHGSTSWLDRICDSGSKAMTASNRPQMSKGSPSIDT